MMNDLIHNALMEIAKTGFENFSFYKLSERSGIPLKQIFQAIEDLESLPPLIAEYINSQALESLNLSMLAQETPRNRIFEIMMARFDVMQNYRGALLSMIHHTKTHVSFVPKALDASCLTSRFILETAGLLEDGMKKHLQIKAMMTLYLLTLRTWVDDQSEDLSKTMAGLDKNLSVLEKLTTSFFMPFSSQVQKNPLP